MKQVAVICLLAVLLIPLNKELTTYMLFELNQSSIAAELCVNRDKPVLQCNGKCALKQRLQKIDQSSPASKIVKPKPIQLIQFVLDALTLKESSFLQRNRKGHSCYRVFGFTDYYPSVFHPPPELMVIQKDLSHKTNY